MMGCVEAAAPAQRRTDARRRTPEAVLAAEAAEAAAAPEVFDDLEDIRDDAGVLDVGSHPDYVAKLEKRVASRPLALLHPPRAGKKCLCLDIDYTLFDHRSPAETPMELARPHLHSFLAAAYAEYGARTDGA